MDKLKNLYLIRLFKENKIVFCFVLLFIFFQQYFYLKDNSTFPWFVWSMYSHEEYYPEMAKQTELFINGKRFDISSIPIWQEATVMHTFEKYIQIKKNNYIDPMKSIVIKRISNLSSFSQNYISSQIENKKTAVIRYPVWILSYLEKYVYKDKIKTIEFKEVKYNYRDNIFTKSDSSQTLLKIIA